MDLAVSKTKKPGPPPIAKGAKAVEHTWPKMDVTPRGEMPRYPNSSKAFTVWLVKDDGTQGDQVGSFTLYNFPASCALNVVSGVGISYGSYYGAGSYGIKSPDHVDRYARVFRAIRNHCETAGDKSNHSKVGRVFFTDSETGYMKDRIDGAIKAGWTEMPQFRNPSSNNRMRVVYVDVGQAD
jgi:hypothetical protein